MTYGLRRNSPSGGGDMPDGASVGVSSVSGILHPHGGKYPLAASVPSGQPDRVGGLSGHNIKQRDMAFATA